MSSNAETSQASTAYRDTPPSESIVSHRYATLRLACFDKLGLAAE